MDTTKNKNQGRDYEESNQQSDIIRKEPGYKRKLPNSARPTKEGSEASTNKIFHSSSDRREEKPWNPGDKPLHPVVGRGEDDDRRVL